MYTPSAPRRPLPPAVLDPILGPATKGHTGTTAVLACLTAATQKRIAPHHAQQWLNDRRPDLTRHVNNPRTWARLVAAARDRVKQTETLSGRRELARVVLARTLAHALSSFPWIDEQGELDLTARLVLIADAASGESGLVHVDPVTDWGVSAAGVRNARTLLMRAGCYDPDADLGETLTTYGRATGALARAAEAEQERAAAAAQQVDAVTAARERAKKARAIVKKALRAAQAEVGVTVPGPDDPAELRPAWARSVHAHLTGVDQGLRVAVRRELARRLTRAGHPDREARAVADRLAPDEPHPAAA